MTLPNVSTHISTLETLFFKIPAFSNFSSLLDIDDGFRLTYLGYDFLAIKTMVNRGIFTAVGRQIGVGKESGNIVFIVFAFVLIPLRFCFMEI